MNNAVQRFLGDSISRVIIKLLVLSLIAGVVMAAVGWTPLSIYRGVIEFFQRLWNLGFDAIYSAGEYLILGAAIVVPFFLIVRLISYRSNRS